MIAASWLALGSHLQRLDQHRIFESLREPACCEYIDVQVPCANVWVLLAHKLQDDSLLPHAHATLVTLHTLAPTRSADSTLSLTGAPDW